MISVVFYILSFVSITPQNPFVDRYTVIPPLGRIQSIAPSPFNIYVISDNYILVFEKQSLALKQTIHFDTDISVVGYDAQYDDIWILSPSSLIRFTPSSFTMREFTLTDKVTRFAIVNDWVYLDGVKDYRMNKATGELNLVQSFPGNLRWYRKTTQADIRTYTFLTPYYYFDEPRASDSPFREFQITALCDDGMDLYVGTDRYGLLKYNKVSWLKQRVLYGPLDLKVRKVREFDNKIHFITSQGLSYYTGTDWDYKRSVREITDILPFENRYVVSIGNQLSETSNGMVISLGNFSTAVLCLSQDEDFMYIGTRSGLFKIAHGTTIELPFGPTQHPVYAVYPTQREIFVGGELGFYAYDRERATWSERLRLGVKDIVKIHDALYLLGVNNQIIEYRTHGDSSVGDTNWILLPYFNIYDIDADSEVVYCASYAGIYYYEPTTQLYKVIYNLPRITYDYVFVIDKKIIAVSAHNIFTLPVDYRD